MTRRAGKDRQWVAGDDTRRRRRRLPLGRRLLLAALLVLLAALVALGLILTQGGDRADFPDPLPALGGASADASTRAAIPSRLRAAQAFQSGQSVSCVIRSEKSG